MCRLHEERVTYSGCKLLNENGSISNVMQYWPFSNSQPCEPHLLIHKDIYLCEKASSDSANRTCAVVTRFIEGLDVGLSRARGQCPVCDAAERAVKETSFQTEYVCSLTLNHLISD